MRINTKLNCLSIRVSVRELIAKTLIAEADSA